MFKLEIDSDGIIRGKCYIDAPLAILEMLKIPGPFVDDEIGSSLVLPAEPIYKSKKIVGGTHRPDLIPAMVTEQKPELTIEGKIAALESEIYKLKESIKKEP